MPSLNSTMPKWDLDIQNISLLHLMKSMKHIISIHANRAIIFSKAFIFSFIAQQGLMGRQWHHYNNLSKFLFLRVVSSMKISKQFFNYSSNMYIFSLWPMDRYYVLCCYYYSFEINFIQQLHVVLTSIILAASCLFRYRKTR